MNEINPYKDVLSKLKTQKGCSISELDSVLSKDPTFAGLPDFTPKYPIMDGVIKLVEWGLIDAYLDGRLLTYDEFKQFGRWEWPENIQYYISKRALDLEAVFDIEFDKYAVKSVYGDPDTKREWPEIFVLMPFSDSLTPVFEDHILKAGKKFGLKTSRADNFFSTKSIMEDIWSAINAAKIIIADCTGRNPNVFYEVGIAHTLGKPTILISQSMDDIPFDLRHLRVIIYEYTPRGMESFDLSLQGTIEDINSPRSKSHFGNIEDLRKFILTID